MSTGLIDQTLLLYRDSQLRIEINPIDPTTQTFYVYTGDYTDESRYRIERGDLEEIAKTSRDLLKERIIILLGERFLEETEKYGLIPDSIGFACSNAYITEKEKEERFRNKRFTR